MMPEESPKSSALFGNQPPTPDHTGLAEKNLPNAFPAYPASSTNSAVPQRNSGDCYGCISSKATRIKQRLNTLITRKTLFLGATALILTILSYRYISYVALKDQKDHCLALAKASNLPISPECVQALIGPLKPPPYHLYRNEDNQYQEDFHTLLREWVLFSTDKVFLRLWEFLVFGNRTVPDLPLLFYATVAFPVHAARVLLPFPILQNGGRADSAFLLNICVWLLCYYAVGLTGIWFTACDIITLSLQWSHTYQRLINTPDLALLGMAMYELVASVSGVLLTFSQHSISQNTDVMLSEESLESDMSSHVAEVETQESDALQNSTATRPSPRARVFVLAWRALECGRLILIALTCGWRALPLAAIEILIRFHLNIQLAALMQKNNPSRLHRLLYMLLSGSVLIALSEADRFLTQREVLGPRTIEFLWTRQLYFEKVRLDGRRAFSQQVDAVLQGHDASIAYNSTYFRRWHKDGIIGIDAFPEPWARLSEFLQRAAGIDAEDYAWIRNEL